jgi:hypothetical protein
LTLGGGYKAWLIGNRAAHFNGSAHSHSSNTPQLTSDWLLGGGGIVQAGTEKCVLSCAFWNYGRWGGVNASLHCKLQRLAAANMRAPSATKIMDSARQMLETAREYLDSSCQEVKAAKAQLKEAENRWKVIDVDDINGMSMAASTKRMEVSVSLSDGIFTNGVRQIDAPLAAIAIGSSISTGSGSIRGAAHTHISNDSAETIHTQIVPVVACGRG